MNVSTDSQTQPRNLRQSNDSNEDSSASKTPLQAELDKEVEEQIAKKLLTLKHAVEFRRKFNFRNPSALESSVRKILWNYGIQDEDLPHYP